MTPEELQAIKARAESGDYLLQSEEDIYGLIAEVESLEAQLRVAVEALKEIGLATNTNLGTSVYLFRERARVALEKIDERFRK